MQGDLPIGCAQPQATKQQTTFQGQAKSSQGCPTSPLRPSVKDTDVSLSVYVILCSQLVESFLRRQIHIRCHFFNRKLCCSLALRGVGQVINAIKNSRHLTICHNFETSHKSFVYDGFSLKSITTHFFKLNDLSSLFILFHFK
jgi:hypothetical protein